MQKRSISRRSFLKCTALTACGLALDPIPFSGVVSSLGIGRVTIKRIGLYREPSFRAERLAWLMRDECVSLYDRVMADEGPWHNPLWYRLADGYAHSGHIQRVQWNPQGPCLGIPAHGALFEVSIPFTRSYRQPDPASDPIYRLYYESTAWVKEIVTGSDRRLWYRLEDDLLPIDYYVRAEHLRRIPPQELTPISPEIPLRHKRIEISIAQQELRAYTNDQLVLRTRISSGMPNQGRSENGIPTDTPTGSFYVDKKMPLRHMGYGHVTSDLEAYELPGVPWVSFFHYTGVAIHGTYWHDDFGRQKSHGCINMRSDEAKWLYRWTLPTVSCEEKLRIGRGTAVIVR